MNFVQAPARAKPTAAEWQRRFFGITSCANEVMRGF